MLHRAMRRAVTVSIVMCLAVASASFASDRHVYLDTDGDGILNDCPNPSHNVTGTNTTDTLQFCLGGTQGGKAIGTVSGTVTAAACTAANGSVSGVRNGDRVDVDRDGGTEYVYGHPQACVWHMSVSDSCEIHAGTYRRAGAAATAATGDTSALGGTTEACDLYDCWFASFVANGHGPNLNDNAYGTAALPAFVRGANVLGSIDTWDGNGNKRPDKDEGLPSYPAVLNGDRNGNGTFDGSTCTGATPDTCTGDTYFMAFVGCGTRGASGTYGQGLCGGNFGGGERGIFIDTNADGVFETEITNQGGAQYGPKNTDHLVIKDLEFTRFNGGNGGGSGGGTRQLNGHFNMISDGSGVGMAIDHVYVHDNDYALAQTNKSMWSVFGDYQNGYCRDVSSGGNPTNYTEYRNNLLYLQTARLVENDNDFNARGGCPFKFHDNRVIVDISNNPSRSSSVKLFYLKPIDQSGANTTPTPKVHRIYNNEFILKSWGPSGTAHFFDLQGFGNGQGTGLGEIWMYGNLVRLAPSGSPPATIHEGWCSSGNPAASGSGRFYFFANTIDASTRLEKVCRSSDTPRSELLIERNNALFGVTAVYADTVASPGFNSISRANNCVTESGKTPDSCTTDIKANWFSGASLSATLWNGIDLYWPKDGLAGGELAGTGSCDPDGDGIRGVDYDGDGLNDTTWFDLAGNMVNCVESSATIDIGAIQGTAGGGRDLDPPGTVSRSRRTDVKQD